MCRKRITRVLTALAIVTGLGVAAYASRDRWLPLIRQSDAGAKAEDQQLAIEDPKVLRLSRQARSNLRLVAKPVATQSYWRTIQVPGIIVDRPGLSDRGVTSPAVGVVTKVHAFAGDTVKPGQRLFTLQLFSEYLQNTQSELFKATRETQLISEELARLQGLANSGTIAGKKIIELQQQIRRQDGLIQSYHQDLLTRGLTPAHIARIAQGKFVSSIEVAAPPVDKPAGAAGQVPTVGDVGSEVGSEVGRVGRLAVRPINVSQKEAGEDLIYEVQELRVDLGQQVQAGQLLSVLSNHRLLYIEGHAFKREATSLERASQERWPVQVEFAEDDGRHWPALDQEFLIRHLANTIDLSSRTFDFFISLTNQSRHYAKGGRTFVVWRFRPGQRVRLHVPVEQLEDVLVIPAEAVVREGAEAYVFQQNGDLFHRLAVHVLHEDRRNIVLANDGSLTPGLYLAQSAAASLNRVLKAQTASGMRADVHVHADGTVHAAH